MTADASLRENLQRYGLYPSDIIWDGRFHNFPGKGKGRSNNSGWYIADANRRSATFGDKSQVDPYGKELSVPWFHGEREEPTKDQREHWRHQEKKVAKAQKKRRERAAKEVAAAWEAATPAKQHPYLTAKMCEADGLRVLTTGTTLRLGGFDWTAEEDVLLVPMLRDGELVGLQRIARFGREKMQKRFWPGAEVGSASHVIGGKLLDIEKEVYICEGWATGWSIVHVTGRPCVCAFSVGGLVPVAQALRRKYAKAKLVVAADNDRWTEGNPGVKGARAAAAAVKAKVAIPDFAKLDSHPTDFNDLLLLEGKHAVKRWIMPENAGGAKTSPPPSAKEQKAKEEDEWPFRCLGVNDGVYYYMPKRIGQIHKMTYMQHSGRTLLHLAPIEWWEERYRLGRGVDWMRAASAVQSKCMEQGIFEKKRMRGRGWWREDEDPVVHMGDRLLAPGTNKWVAPESYASPSGKVYYRLPRLDGPSLKRRMPVAEAQSLLDIFTSRDWETEAAGYLLAGWTVLAPFCGALDWRPHVWLTGEQGAGKTTVLQRMVVPLLGRMGLVIEGGSTEAGIRQTLKGDALPVIYDEGERSTKAQAAQMQSVIGLARSSSSTRAKMVKGTQTGTSMQFEATSMFLFSAIGVALKTAQDKSRVTVLALRKRDSEARTLEWRQFSRRLLEEVTMKAGRELLARTARWFRTGEFDRLLRNVLRAAHVVLDHDARMATQYGTLASGAWMLMGDEVPGESEVSDWMHTVGISDLRPEDPPEPQRILARLMQHRELMRIDQDLKHVTIGDLVAAAVHNPLLSGKPDIPSDEADRTLRQLGLRVFGREDDEDCRLAIANSSSVMRGILKDTPWRDNWWRFLRSIPGCEALAEGITFGKLQRSRGTVIPYSLLS